MFTVFPSFLSHEPQVNFNVTQTVADSEPDGSSPGGRIKGTALAAISGVIANDWRLFFIQNMNFFFSIIATEECR